MNYELAKQLREAGFPNSKDWDIGGSNCLQKPYNIHRNRLKTLAFYY